MTNENSGCGKTIATLGVIASIIAIFTFLTGIVSIKDIIGSSQRPGDNPPPTEYYQQVDTVPPPATDTPQPVSVRKSLLNRALALSPKQRYPAWARKKA
jgi:hypothetical protein